MSSDEPVVIYHSTEAGCYRGYGLVLLWDSKPDDVWERFFRSGKNRMWASCLFADTPKPSRTYEFQCVGSPNTTA